MCLISDFRREADENCALLGYYAECSGIFLRRFRTTCRSWNVTARSVITQKSAVLNYMFIYFYP